MMTRPLLLVVVVALCVTAGQARSTASRTVVRELLKLLDNQEREEAAEAEAEAEAEDPPPFCICLGFAALAKHDSEAEVTAAVATIPAPCLEAMVADCTDTFPDLDWENEEAIGEAFVEEYGEDALNAAMEHVPCTCEDTWFLPWAEGEAAVNATLALVPQKCKDDVKADCVATFPDLDWEDKDDVMEAFCGEYGALPGCPGGPTPPPEKKGLKRVLAALKRAVSKRSCECPDWEAMDWDAAPTTFTCTNGEVLEDARYVNDGMDDCGDCSDEPACAAECVPETVWGLATCWERREGPEDPEDPEEINSSEWMDDAGPDDREEVREAAAEPEGPAPFCICLGFAALAKYDSEEEIDAAIATIPAPCLEAMEADCDATFPGLDWDAEEAVIAAFVEEYGTEALNAIMEHVPCTCEDMWFLPWAEGEAAVNATLAMIPQKCKDDVKADCGATFPDLDWEDRDDVKEAFCGEYGALPGCPGGPTPPPEKKGLKRVLAALKRGKRTLLALGLQVAYGMEEYREGEQ